MVHTAALLHRCSFLGRPLVCCALQLCSLLPCDLVGQICSSLLYMLFLCRLPFLVLFLFLVHSCWIFVLDCLSNGPFSFALSSVAIALLSIYFSFVAFLSFAFAFVFALSFSFVDGSCVHRCSSSIEICCYTGCGALLEPAECCCCPVVFHDGCLGVCVGWCRSSHEV